MAAGESAAERARRMREKVARLERAAEKWERGADGERRIGSLLDGLPSDFAVFHDVKLPGSNANVDHLVVGPGGIWTVDTKNYSHPVKFGTGKGAGALWSGRWALTKTFETSAWEAAVVSDLIGYHVEPVMCIIAPKLPSPAFDFGGIWVCAPTHLLDQLELTRERIEVPAAVAAVRSALGVEPSVRDLVPSRSSPFPMPRAGSSRARTRAARRPRPALREWQLTGLKLIALLVVFVVGLPLLPRIGGALGEWYAGSVTDRLQGAAATSTTTTNAAAPTTSLATASTVTAGDAVAVPPAAEYVVGCAADGRRWDVSVEWPGELPTGVSAVGLRIRRGDDSFRFTHTRTAWADRDPIVITLNPEIGDYWIVIEYLAADGTALAESEEPLDPAAC